MQQTHQKINKILIFDGIAILCIVFFHEFLRYPGNPLYLLTPYLVTMGLALFTFSSGYKLLINHQTEMSNKDFLGSYYVKRFIRLYKPYLGYSLLTLVPLLAVTWISLQFLHLDFPAGTIFTRLICNANLSGILNFLAGVNPIADQLWYLVGLVVILSFCFTILYFLNTRWLFWSFIPLLAASILIQIGLIPHSLNILNFFTYAPFFISGCYWGNCQQNGDRLRIPNYYLPALFLVLMALSVPASPLKLLMIYLSCFLFPMFLAFLFPLMEGTKIPYPFLIFCGTYSFQIYLFHQPLILHILSTGIIDIFKISFVFMPIVVSILTIYCCVIVYQIVRHVHLNILFE